MSAFDKAFAFVLGHEGGLSKEAADPGNWTGGRVGQGVLKGTTWGISAAAYPMLDIAALTPADAQAIYRRDYWEPLACDSLPPPLALLVFDAGVNNGVGWAARWLQGVAGAVPDGAIGPLTQALLSKILAERGGAAICAEFQAQRLAFMAGLAGWRIFGLGWARRLCALPYQSLQMEAN